MKRCKSALLIVLFLASALIIGSPALAQPPGGASPQIQGDELEQGIEQEIQKEKKKKAKKPQKPIPAIKMVLIKGGCFMMGDPTAEGDDDERPAHEVCVGDYYLSETEVTLELYDAVMEGVDLSGLDPKTPVTNISWRWLNNFISELNKRTKGFYRLPTEAEWEYAAREGGKNVKWAGTDNESELSDYAWFADNSEGGLHPVKQKKPNKLGLYDMNGNAAEWVEDYYAFDFYQTSTKKNPYGPDMSSWRTVRGGSSEDASFKARNTYRYALEPLHRTRTIGFRLAE